MATIGLLAIGLGFLHYPSIISANACITCYLALVTTSVLGILLCRDLRRAYWTGVLVFGGTYLMLSLAPWFEQEVGTHLLSTSLLDVSYPWLVAPSPKLVASLPAPDADPPAPGLEPVSWTRLRNNEGREATVNVVGPYPMHSTDEFRRIGHSLFGILVAFIGGRVALSFASRRVTAAGRRSKGRSKGDTLIYRGCLSKLGKIPPDI
jgi:hypothetical protein